MRYYKRSPINSMRVPSCRKKTMIRDGGDLSTLGLYGVARRSSHYYYYFDIIRSFVVLFFVVD